MKKRIIQMLFPLVLLSLMLISCKKDDKVPEPAYVLQKWAKSLEKLNYKKYSKCEAYPKAESVFREMYRDYYIIDIATIDVEDADEKEIRKNYKGDSFLHRAVSFEGTAVKRDSKKPYQLIRGDAVFVKFIDGKRKNDGWLMSNRTLTRINK